jgi:hypothetical protein
LYRAKSLGRSRIETVAAERAEEALSLVRLAVC